MIRNVLAKRDLKEYCPLCNRPFNSKRRRTKEHIFAKWLQERYGLWDADFRIPNMFHKKYRSVRIGVCQQCNNETFGSLESRISKASEESLDGIDDDIIAAWLSKIFYLNALNTTQFNDFGPGANREETILPSEMREWMTYPGMLLNAFAFKKSMFSCFSFGFGTWRRPYSLYRYQIKSEQSWDFDYMDFPFENGVALRLGSRGFVLLLDAGLHQKFRGPEQVVGENILHPLQFREVVARHFYDLTVLEPRARQLRYAFAKQPNAVFAQIQWNEKVNPFHVRFHDESRYVQVISRFIPDFPRLLEEAGEGNIPTTLHDESGSFALYPGSSS